MKVLLVDDSRFIRNSEKRFFDKLGYKDMTFFEAPGGKSAISLYDEEQPELVLLDLLIEDMHGTDVLKHIRERGENCFVAVLSSDKQRPMVDRVMGMGANLFMPKPCTQEKLSKIMEAFKISKK